MLHGLGGSKGLVIEAIVEGRDGDDEDRGEQRPVEIAKLFERK